MLDWFGIVNMRIQRLRMRWVGLLHRLLLHASRHRNLALD
jgi:hypothetical protein